MFKFKSKARALEEKIQAMAEQIEEKDDRIAELTSLACKWQGSFGREKQLRQCAEERLARAEKRLDTMDEFYGEIAGRIINTRDEIKRNHYDIKDLLSRSTDVKYLRDLEDQIGELKKELDDAHDANGILQGQIADERRKRRELAKTISGYGAAIQQAVGVHKA